MTKRPQDIGLFKTPRLRNVANTGPYMHDGSIATLEEAVDRELDYRSQGSNDPVILTLKEKSDLISFLRPLTSPAFDTPNAKSSSTTQGPAQKRPR